MREMLTGPQKKQQVTRQLGGLEHGSRPGAMLQQAAQIDRGERRVRGVPDSGDNMLPAGRQPFTQGQQGAKSIGGNSPGGEC